MKTPYQVQQELERLERLVPHIISDQGDRAEEILGFHVASLLGSAPASEHALIRERTCLLYTSQSPRDATLYRMPSSA